MDVTVRRENFISTNFGVTLEQRANTIITVHLKLNTDIHEASRGFSATAELFVLY